MIFYFSGTGNSLQIAKEIATFNKTNIISITSAIRNFTGQYDYELEDNEVIGFVYPVYAWAPPKQVLDFIDKLNFKNYNNNYIFTVATCGENVGNTIKVIKKALSKKNLALNSGFSIKMPNNYIILGNVDSKEVENAKLNESEKILYTINNTIANRKYGIFQVNKGPLPTVMTSIINPLFNKNATKTKKFYANDNCNGCGLCEKICNSGTIKLKEKPFWGDDCTQCLACIHLCPTRAIQFGKGTEKKGRYLHPKIAVNEMIIK